MSINKEQRNSKQDYRTVFILHWEGRLCTIKQSVPAPTVGGHQKETWVSWKADRCRAQRGGTSGLMKESWEEGSKETYLREIKGKEKKWSNGKGKKEENQTDDSSV